MDLFISIDQIRTNWRLNPADFVAGLARQWPLTKLRVISDTNRPASHKWSIPFPESAGKTLDGFLSRTLALISLEGTLADVAAFAIWFRSIVPPDVLLTFFSDQHPGKIFIDTDTDVSSLIEHFR